MTNTINIALLDCTRGVSALDSRRRRRPESGAHPYYTVDSPEGRRFMRRCFSHKGMHQGCCLATGGAMMASQKGNREVCNEFPDVVMLLDADDTVMDVPNEQAADMLAFKGEKQAEAELTSASRPGAQTMFMN